MSDFTSRYELVSLRADTWVDLNPDMPMAIEEDTYNEALTIYEEFVALKTEAPSADYLTILQLKCALFQMFISIMEQVRRIDSENE